MLAAKNSFFMLLFIGIPDKTHIAVGNDHIGFPSSTLGGTGADHNNDAWAVHNTWAVHGIYADNDDNDDAGDHIADDDRGIGQRHPTCLVPE